MAMKGNKGKQQGRKGKQQQVNNDVDDKDLGRFAGSSDEDDELPVVEQTKNLPSPVDEVVQKADIVKEKEDSDSNEIEDDALPNSGFDEDDDASSVIDTIERDQHSASKMANVIGHILGGQDKRAKPTANVVLGKTTTPLQKLQQQEREKAKALKEKRQTTRERNLSALHIPLSIATSNNVATEGRLSVAKELEQERFHRRVATRGVVALFNAISQHQRSNTQVANVRMCVFAMSFFVPDVVPSSIQPFSLLLDRLVIISARSSSSCFQE
jgi:hypothetical protein